MLNDLISSFKSHIPSIFLTKEKEKRKKLKHQKIKNPECSLMFFFLLILMGRFPKGRHCVAFLP